MRWRASKWTLATMRWSKFGYARLVLLLSFNDAVVLKIFSMMRLFRKFSQWCDCSENFLNGAAVLEILPRVQLHLAPLEVASLQGYGCTCACFPMVQLHLAPPEEMVLLPFKAATVFSSSVIRAQLVSSNLVLIQELSTKFISLFHHILG